MFCILRCESLALVSPDFQLLKVGSVWMSSVELLCPTQFNIPLLCGYKQNGYQGQCVPIGIPTAPATGLETANALFKQPIGLHSFGRGWG